MELGTWMTISDKSQSNPGVTYGLILPPYFENITYSHKNKKKVDHKGYEDDL